MRTNEAASRAMAEAVQICRQQGLTFDDVIALAQYYGVELALRNNHENQTKAAGELQVHRNTLSRLIRQQGVPKVPKSERRRHRRTVAA